MQQTPCSESESPQGSDRIRCFVRSGGSAADGGPPLCPKHRIPAIDALCPGCIDLGTRSGAGVCIRLERILGGTLQSAIRVQAALQREVDGFLQTRGVKHMTPPAPRILSGLLDRNSVVPQAIRACRELCQLIEAARFAERECELELEKLGYCGIPSEEKLERLVSEASDAARFLETWDGIAFDAAHELQLENCARRIVVNSRDARTVLDSIRFRPLDAVKAAARRREAALDAIRPRIISS